MGATANEAFVEVIPPGGFAASTFSGGSFVVTNTATGGANIDSVRFDLSTTFMPDIVFDPLDGTPAGDTAAKCLVIDSGGTATGFQNPVNPCNDPFSIDHENGYDRMELFFAAGEFAPGEQITFSVDIDPTTIQGVGGAGGAGSISGLEISGATVTIEFDDASTLVADLFPISGNDGGAHNIVAPGGPVAPSIALLGLVPPTLVANASQTVRIAGPAGAAVRLLVIEGELDTGGNPPFDLEPFEANNAIAIQDIAAVIGGGGTVDVPVTLTDTAGNGGLNHLFAAIEDPLPSEQGAPRTGPISNVLVVELDSSGTNGVLGATPPTLDFGVIDIGTSSLSQQVILTNLGQPGDATISVSSITTTGEFSDVSTPIALAPGDSLPVDVTFAPTVTGAVAETLDVVHDGVNSPFSVPLSGEAIDPSTIQISFSSSDLQGEISNNPTSLQFGPDDRLYVAQVDGTLFAYTIVRNAPGDYQVTATEQIDLVKNIPNHDDDGTASTQSTRQVTGLLVTGTPQNPVLYVSSSDPRIGGGGSGGETGLDTNSGIVSRLTWNGVTWDKVDIVRGLPRSEENHSTNGLALDEATRVLYLVVGGHTNKGAPSNNFAQTQEYALAAAMLSIDLDAIEALPVLTDGAGQDYAYDIPTLDDPTRGTPGQPDPGDPFGGSDGRNQARIVPGGPVQIYSPGYRNAYDVVLTESGRIYTVDNGPNSGWGGIPIGDGTPSCTNETNEGQSTAFGDGLHLVTPGYYAGHPHPTRGNPTTSDLVIYENQSGSWIETDRYDWQTDFPDPPVPFAAADARQCEYLDVGIANDALAVNAASTNGLAEYTASNFSTVMRGDLLAADFSGSIVRYELNALGDATTNGNPDPLFTGFGPFPLDITTQGDTDVFPGTIWVAVFGNGNIAVFEPQDFMACTGADDDFIDEDGDSYSNGDEIDNGTDPCSGGSKPPDHDQDGLSDLNDADDDADGVPDRVDAFALDPANGLVTHLPLTLPFFNIDPGTGFFGLGLTGLMIDGATDYLTQFDPALLDAGGAAGLLAFNQVTEGTALGATNTQDNAFQVGLNLDTTSPVFSVHTRLESPYFGVGGSPTVPIDAQGFGLQIGTGHQDAYLAVLFDANGGAGGVRVVLEDGGVVSSDTTYGSLVVGDILGSIFVDIYISVDPAALTAQASVALDGAAIIDLGSPLPIPAAWLDSLDAQGLAAGVISTAAGSAQPFGAIFDFLDVTPGPAGSVCLVDTDCDDGIACTADACVMGACTAPPEPLGTACEADGNLCSVDVCDGAGACGFDTDIMCVGLGEVCEATSGLCGVPPNDIDGDGLISSDPCPLEVRNACFGDVALDPLGPDGLGGTGDDDTEIRINAGLGLPASGARTDCSGDVWVADYGFQTGTSVACDLGGGGESCVIGGIPAIFGCENEATEDLFQGDRSDPLAAPELTYSFPVPNRDYLVNLLFANTEGSTAAPGSRSFDIVIEGAVVAPDFDPVVAAGGSGIAILRSFPVTVIDGDGLQIGFVHGVGDPALKAIEVLAGPCVVDLDCEDANTCTSDTCNAGVCEFTAVADLTPCDDGFACTSVDACNAGACEGVPDDLLCNDAEFCTVDSCVVGAGCVNDGAPNQGLTCDDNDPGTLIDFCEAGACAGQVVSCIQTVLQETFDVDPPNWIDTGANNSATVVESYVGGDDLGADLVYSTTAPLANTHSHLVSSLTDSLLSYSLTARGQIDTNDGGWGVLVASDYPVAGSFGDSYYRVRRFAGNPTFEMAPHGTSLDCGPGGFDLGFAPTPGAWFHVRLEFEDQGTQTAVRAWAWADGQTQPIAPQADCVDTSPTRRTGGTIGVWSMGTGGRYWDDLTITTLGGSCDDGLFCTGIEACDNLGICQAGTPVACDDSVPCTDDACNETTDSCDVTPVDTLCDDGLFCTGSESCDPLLGCQTSGDPCPAGTFCDEGANLCDPCPGDFDCDGLPDATDLCPTDPLGRCAASLGTAACAAANGNCGTADQEIRFDAGPGAGATDCNGDVWHAETGFPLGTDFGGSGSVAVDTASVVRAFGCSDPSTLALVKSHRAGAPLARTYPVANGDYGVALLFLESDETVCAAGSGARVFDVEVEGVMVLPDFDPFAISLAENGVGCGGLVVKSVQTSVSDGLLEIDLTRDGASAYDASLQAIQVVALPLSCSLDPECDDADVCTVNTCGALGYCESTPTTDGVVCDDGVLCTTNDVCTAGTCGGISDSDGDGLGDVQNPSCQPDPCPSEPLNECAGDVALDGLGPDDLPGTGDDDTPIRVSTGPACAVDFTDCRGLPWTADFGAVVPGASFSCDLPGSCSVDTTALFGCTDVSTEALFQCGAIDPVGGDTLDYDFDVADGRYLVNLLFMNGLAATSTPGSRIFDVAFEGYVRPGWNDLDPVELGGGSVPIGRSIVVDVADGNGLQIELLHDIAGDPIVNGIEVRYVPEPGSIPTWVCGAVALSVLAQRRSHRASKSRR